MACCQFCSLEVCHTCIYEDTASLLSRCAWRYGYEDMQTEIWPSYIVFTIPRVVAAVVSVVAAVVVRRRGGLPRGGAGAVGISNGCMCVLVCGIDVSLCIAAQTVGILESGGASRG